MSDEINSLDPDVRWIANAARNPVATDPDIRRRIMAGVAAMPRPRRESRLRTWITEPRPFALPPITAMALAAGLVGIGVITGLQINRDGRTPAEQPRAVAAGSQLPDSIAPVVVKFVLVAPQAARVAVVGDFNDWDTEATPAERQPDGTWVTFAQLRPGRHVYSFVVDGRHFVNDPGAPLAPDDGYGHRNSVLVVSRAVM